MKQISLTQGKYALVDDDVYDYLMQWKWHYSKGYARRNGEMKNRVKSPSVSMHRVVTSASREMHVDHINHDKLDNRKSNLRLCTNSQNCKNRKVRDGFSSRFKGVQFFKRDNNWMARIKVNYKSIYLGYFPTEEAAARAYDLAAIKHHGEFARLNLACSRI